MNQHFIACVKRLQQAGLGTISSTTVRSIAIGLFGLMGWLPANAADVLLVDDSFNEYSERQVYVEALTALGIPFDLWYVPQRHGEPRAGVLSKYRAVVWFSGANVNTPGPESGSESEIAAYLNGGGRMFVESQSWHRRSGITNLMRSHLGLLGLGLPIPRDGILGDGVFKGSGPYALDCPGSFRLLGASLVPTPGAEAAFRWDNPTAPIGLSKQTNAYRTVYTAFPLACVVSPAQRVAVLERAMNFFGVAVDPPVSSRPDIYEPNDTPTAATVAPLSVAALGLPIQEHTLDFVGDTDWLKFIADPKNTYVFTAKVVKGSREIAFELLDAELNVVRIADLNNFGELVISARELSGRYYLRFYYLGGRDRKFAPPTVQIMAQVVSPYPGLVSGVVLDAQTGEPTAGVDVRIENTAVMIESQPSPSLGEYILTWQLGTVSITAGKEAESHVAKTQHCHEMKPNVEMDKLDFSLTPVAKGARGIGPAPVNDADGDGMDDVEEAKYGLDPTDASDNCIDSDGDGFANIDELQSKTDPFNPKSNKKTLMALLMMIQFVLMDDETGRSVASP